MADPRLDRRSAIGLSAAAVLVGALTACSARPDDTPGTTTPDDAAGPDRLMFIRHAEEPGRHGQAPYGVTEAGALDPDSLSVRGWTRAGALVTLFDPRGADGHPLPTRPQLSRPSTIFASDPGRTHSKRSLQTVTALAAALNLQVDSRCTSTQTAQLADSLSAVAGSALVAWKHELIPDIISRLAGVTPAPPPPWPAGRYDLIYVLTRDGDRWLFAQVAQRLLAGDSSTPAG